MIYVCMYGWMDAWMDACMYGWMDGWMHVCMDGWMHACMHACMYGWMDGWMHVCMYGWMDGCMYVWMDGCMDVRYGKRLSKDTSLAVKFSSLCSACAYLPSVIRYRQSIKPPPPPPSPSLSSCLLCAECTHIHLPPCSTAGRREGRGEERRRRRRR